MDDACCWSVMEEFELCGMQELDEKVMPSRAGYHSGPWHKRRNPSACETATSEVRVLKLGVGFMDERQWQSSRTSVAAPEERVKQQPPPVPPCKDIRTSLSSIARSQKFSPLESVPTEYILNNIASTAQVVFCEDDLNEINQSSFRKPGSSALRSTKLQGTAASQAFPDLC